tara:strand:+ start:2151 stop:3266 length:1116 start_codon:yes stop_codon:yes gene_type:complete
MGVIGYSTIGATLENIDNSDRNLVIDNATYVYTAPASEQVFKLWFYVGAVYSGDASGVDIGVYDVTSGTNNAPLVASGNIPSMSLSSWNSVTITPVALTAGNLYAVGLRVVSATQVRSQYLYGAGASSLSVLTGTSALPDPWDDVSGSSRIRSMYAETEAAASGPVITNVNTTNVVQVGDTPVVTGTSFLATGGTQSWGGVSVGFSSWADTSITSSAITRGDLAYNTNYDWIVTDNLAAASTAQSVQLAIETGYQVVTLSSPIIVLVGGYRTSLCYGSVPDCVTGDQLRAPTTTNEGKALTINVDGTFSIAAAGNTEQTFSFEVWDANAATNDKWSASTAVVVNGVIVGGGGILRNVLRSPLKDILRNVLK